VFLSGGGVYVGSIFLFFVRLLSPHSRSLFWGNDLTPGASSLVLELFPTPSHARLVSRVYAPIAFSSPSREPRPSNSPAQLLSSSFIASVRNLPPHPLSQTTVRPFSSPQFKFVPRCQNPGPLFQFFPVGLFASSTPALWTDSSTSQALPSFDTFRDLQIGAHPAPPPVPPWDARGLSFLAAFVFLLNWHCGSFFGICA